MDVTGSSDPSPARAGSISALYIHIPFCRRECFYCNFTKFRYENTSEAKYTDSLCSELQLRGDRTYAIRTIYFGGGSPAVLSDRSLERIIGAIQDNFNAGSVTEMTVEVNPEECTPEKILFLKRLGFNRISVGVQSFFDNDLIYLSRNHDSATAAAGLKAVLGAGFDSVNADLIIGLPHQERAMMEKNIGILSSMEVDHLSAYLLEGVKSFGKRAEPDPEHQAVQYDLFREMAGSAGFDQYEVSNFCRNGNISEHNMNYWEGGDYIGAGLSASGFTNGTDYTNFTDAGTYHDLIQGKKLPVETETMHEPLMRLLVTGFRLIRGIEKEKLSSIKGKILQLKEEGFLEETDTHYRVVPSRMVVLNEILSYLV